MISPFCPWRRALALLVSVFTLSSAIAADTPEETRARELISSPQFQAVVAAYERDFDRFVAELIKLTEIPAPPFGEKERGEAFARLLRESGIEDVSTDAEGNVIGVRRGKGQGPLLAVAAHLDTVFPAGTGQTEQQLQAIAELRPDAYTGTPSFLRILVEKAAETGVSIASIRKALVSGEAFPPSLRDWLLERGIQGYQAYATADAGLIAYETEARQGLVVDDGILLEIVRPGTDDPVPEGEVGEVVVTAFNPDYPLVRFGTGDLSALLPGPCPTGRTNTRIKGWMGRADQTTKVRGMFVHASQVGEIVKRHPGVLRARLVVEGEMANDRMSLHVEHAGPAEGLEQAVAASVKDITKLRADHVQVVAPGSLPNDGKVIEDARKYA